MEGSFYVCNIPKKYIIMVKMMMIADDDPYSIETSCLKKWEKIQKI
jgi:hypothetical protein